MNIVILTGNYFPKPSPNGNIAHIIAKEFSSSDKVSVVCINRGTIHVKNKNLKIISVSTFHRRIRNYFEERNNSKGVLLTSVYRSLYSMLTGMSPDNWYTRAAFKQLKKINEQKKIDIIISLNNPIEAHKAAIKFKEQYSTKVVSYWLDQYTDVKKLHRFKIFKNLNYKNNLSLEKWIHNTSDLNLINENREKWIIKHFRNDNSEIVHHPLISSKSFPSEVSDENINITYAGTFYKGLRNPTNLLNFFNKIKSNNIKLNIYSKGDCGDILSKYNESDIININEIVDKEELMKIYMQTNILINIGNTNNTQMPSKLYEYIDTGRPILNFYYNDDYAFTLKDYPCQLSIPYNKINDYEDEIMNFIYSYANSILPKEKILSSYYEATPGYIVSLIKSKLNVKN